MKKFNYDNIVKQYTDMTEPTEPPDLPNPPTDTTTTASTTATTTIYSKNILLIDKRVQSYDTIVAATDPSLCIPILFDYYEDTIEDIKQRIVENVEIPQTDNNSKISFQSIGIVQHNMRMPYYNLVYKQPTIEPASTDTASVNTCIIYDVSNADPELHSWAPLRDFILWCKTEYSIQYFDMMACALYADRNWKYVIDNLEIVTNVNIRASMDDTGKVTMGGNWFLETDEISLKDVYFTDAIQEYHGVLGSGNVYNSFIITIGGSVYSFGQNTQGELGVGDSVQKNIPTTITTTNISDKTFRQVSSGSLGTIFLASSGSVYGAGSNSSYRFARLNENPSITYYLTPVLSNSLTGITITSICSGSNYSLFCKYWF